MNKDMEAVLDYCQTDDEFDSFREFINENGAQGLTRKEFMTLETCSDDDAYPILAKAAKIKSCNHIWAVAYRVRKTFE